MRREMNEKLVHAIRARKIQGRITEMQLYEFISRNPRCSLYDMSKGLNWSVGKVQSALRRLKDDLIIETVKEKGRTKKLYSLKKVEDFLDLSKF